MSHNPHSTDNGDSHTRRRSLTTHLTTKRHFSQRHPTTPSGTRDQQAVLHTPFGAHAPSARRCGRRDDVSSSPSPSDGTRLPSTTKTSHQSTSVTSSPQQPRVMTLPCLLPSFKQTDRPVPRRVIDRVVPCCLENQYARGGCPNKSDEDKVGTTLGATQHGVRGVKAVLRGQDGGASGGKGKASRRIETEANGGVWTHRDQCVLPMERLCNTQCEWRSHEASLKQRTRRLMQSVLCCHRRERDPQDGKSSQGHDHMEQIVCCSCHEDAHGITEDASRTHPVKTTDPLRVEFSLTGRELIGHVGPQRPHSSPF